MIRIILQLFILNRLVGSTVGWIRDGDGNTWASIGHHGYTTFALSIVLHLSHLYRINGRLIIDSKGWGITCLWIGIVLDAIDEVAGLSLVSAALCQQ